MKALIGLIIFLLIYLFVMLIWIIVLRQNNKKLKRDLDGVFGWMSATNMTYRTNDEGSENDK